MRLPTDVFEHVCSMLDTRDLARLDIVIRVPERAWTYVIRRRCGHAWCGGRAGVIRLYVAVHATPPHFDYTSTHIYAGKGRVWASQTCACLIDDTLIAIGNEYGLALGRQESSVSQVWFGQPVISVAYLHTGKIWFCTCNHRGYVYYDGRVDPLYAHEQVLTVSGPVGVVGTPYGTLPTQTIPSPCTRISQSAVLIATWHENGYVCTLDVAARCPLHMFDTGSCMGVGTLSVIGDIVCVAGMSWRNGARYGTCPRDTRACTADGRTVVVHRINSGVGVVT